jgi:uncharacterized repeat protein (TIGR04138 family)
MLSRGTAWLAESFGREFKRLGSFAVARVKSPEVPPLVKLLSEDRRYKLEAYEFVRLGLNYAQGHLRMGDESEGPEPSPPLEEGEETIRRTRHITGQQLCDALRQLALAQFGLMAKLVLADWGIRSTSDFGEIVYNLIKIGEMSKSEDDRREDFDDVYDFDEALVRQFTITNED